MNQGKFVSFFRLMLYNDLNNSREQSNSREWENAPNLIIRAVWRALDLRVNLAPIGCDFPALFTSFAQVLAILLGCFCRYFWRFCHQSCWSLQPIFESFYKASASSFIISGCVVIISRGFDIVYTSLDILFLRSLNTVWKRLTALPSLSSVLK